MVEDTHTEYKSEFSDSIAKSIVVFSNTEGGKVLVGVDDSGNPIGLPDVDDTARRCVQMVQDKVRPDVTNTTKVEIFENDGKDLVRIAVTEGPNKPYYLREKGLRAEGVYVRRGASSVQTTEVQFDDMMRSVRSLSYEGTISLNQNLTFEYTKNHFIRAGLAFDDIHMNIMGMKKGGLYTNLGFLFSDQCDFQIKAASFANGRRLGFRDRSEISGSVLKQFDDAMDFVHKHDVTSSEIVGTKRRDVTGYPVEAVRELLLNAIVHRDYNSVGNSLISICDDSLEIVSPGRPVENISEKDLIKGVSFPRNRRLSEVFYRLGLVEAYGTGIPRVYGLYEGSGRMPEMDISGPVFRVTLFRRDMGELDLSDTFTRSEFESEMKMSKSRANMELRRLMSEGSVERIGNGKNTVYRRVRHDP